MDDSINTDPFEDEITVETSTGTPLKALTRQSAANDKWVPTCKICKLFIIAPEIWLEFHKKFERDGVSKADLIRYLNSNLEAINEDRQESEQISRFNRENVDRHLSGFKSEGTTGHCRDFLQCKNQIENGGHDPEFKKSSKAIVITPAVFEASENMIETANEKLTEFIGLQQMVQSLEEILLYFDKTLKDRIKAQELITIEEVESYQKQVSAYIKQKQDLSKLRNTTKITGEAVHKALELTTVAFIEKLKPLLDEGRDSFKTEYPGSSMPDEVFGMVLKRLGESMKDVLPVILKKILTEFRIKDS